MTTGGISGRGLTPVSNRMSKNNAHQAILAVIAARLQNRPGSVPSWRNPTSLIVGSPPATPRLAALAAACNAARWYGVATSLYADQGCG